MAKSGEVVLDWGDGQIQDILTGDFLEMREQDISGPVSDSDLEQLRLNGRVTSYDTLNVYLGPLPDLPRPTLE